MLFQNPHYPAGPVPYENPGYVPPMAGAVGGRAGAAGGHAGAAGGHAGAVGGRADALPEKMGHPGLEGPGGDAGPLPEKDLSDAEKLALYHSLHPDAAPPNMYHNMPPPPMMPHAHGPEPPPAYKAEAEHGERVDDVHMDLGPPDAGAGGHDNRGLVENEGMD